MWRRDKLQEEEEEESPNKVTSSKDGNNNSSDASEKWLVIQTFEQLQHSDLVGKLQRCHPCHYLVRGLMDKVANVTWTHRGDSHKESAC